MTTDDTTGLPVHEIVRNLLSDPTQCSVALLCQAMTIWDVSDGGEPVNVGVSWISSSPEAFVALLRRNSIRPIDFLTNCSNVARVAQLLLSDGVYQLFYERRDVANFIQVMLNDPNPPAGEWLEVALRADHMDRATLGSIVAARLVALSEEAQRDACNRSGQGVTPVPQLIADWMQSRSDADVDVPNPYWSVLDKERFIKVVQAVGRAWPWWIFKANQDGGGANYDRVLDFLKQFDDGRAEVWGPLCLEEAAQCLRSLDGVDRGVFARLCSTTKQQLVRMYAPSLSHLFDVVERMAVDDAIQLIDCRAWELEKNLELYYPTWVTECERRQGTLDERIVRYVDEIFTMWLVKRGWRLVRVVSDTVDTCRRRIFWRGGIHFQSSLTYGDGTKVQTGDLVICRLNEDAYRCRRCGGREIRNATLVLARRVLEEAGA